MIRGLLFGEFDTQAGPKIAFQTPAGCVAPEVWDAVFEYLIAKPSLCGHVLSVVAGVGGVRIVGVPTAISDAKYSRNAYVFNCALVLAANAPDSLALRLEPGLRSVATALRDLEAGRGFLTQPAMRETLFSALPALLAAFQQSESAPATEVRLADDCVVTLRGTTTTAGPTTQASTAGTADGVDEELEGALLWRQPGAPISAVSELGADAHGAAELYERIEGTCSVHAAGGSREAVAALLARNLVVRVAPFAQSYVVTPRVRELFDPHRGGALRTRLLTRCFTPHAQLDDALALLGMLRPGTTAQQLINNHAFKEHRVDDPRVFLTFCLAHGWLAPVPEPHAIEEFACLTEAPNPSSMAHSALRDPRGALRHFV